MSYCRFSSDGFKCDVYVYESVDGFIIHVASNRIVPELPHLPDCNESREVYFSAYFKQMKILETATRQPIGGCYDNKSFTCETREDLLIKLTDISEHGYHVPEWVFSEIKDEIKELRT